MNSERRRDVFHTLSGIFLPDLYKTIISLIKKRRKSISHSERQFKSGQVVLDRSIETETLQHVITIGKQKNETPNIFMRITLPFYPFDYAELNMKKLSARFGNSADVVIRRLKIGKEELPRLCISPVW